MPTRQSHVEQTVSALGARRALTPEDLEQARLETESLRLLAQRDSRAAEILLELQARHAAEEALLSQVHKRSSRLNWSEIKAATEPPWLVPHLITRGSVHLLLARSTIGKTFLSIDMICSGAHGISWASRDLPQFRTLIYLSEGKQNYGQRFLAWAQANNMPFDSIEANVRIQSGISLSSKAAIEEVAEEVQDFQPDLVVFDTFSGTSGVRDENDAAGVATVLESTRQACEPAASLFIHHPNKASQKLQALDARGSGTLYNNVDAVLVMFEQDGRSKAGKGKDLICLSTHPAQGGKVKDAAPITIGGFYIEPVALDVGPNRPTIPAAVMRRAAAQQMTKWDLAVMQHLSPEGMTAEEFIQASGIPKTTAHRYLKQSPYAENDGNGKWVRVNVEEYDEAILNTFVDDDTERDEQHD